MFCTAVSCRRRHTGRRSFAGVLLLVLAGIARAASYASVDAEVYRIEQLSAEKVNAVPGAEALGATADGIWFIGRNGAAFASGGGDRAALAGSAGLVGTPVAAATTPVSGELWVATSEQRMVRLSRTGAITAQLVLPDAPRSLSAAADGSAWVLGDDAVYRVTREGALGDRWPLDGLGVRGAHLIEVDPLGNVAWVASPTTVVRIDRRLPGTFEALWLSEGPMTGMAVDHESGRLWLALADALIGIDGEAPPLRLDAARLGVQGGVAGIAWDAEEARLLLVDEVGIVGVDTDAVVAARLLVRAGIERLVTPPLDFGPSLEVDDAGDPTLLAVRAGALCSGRRCVLDGEYGRLLSVTAATTGGPARFVYDSDSRRWALPRSAVETPGDGRVVVDAVDPYGQRASLAVAPRAAAEAFSAAATPKAGGNKPPVVSLVSPADGVVFTRPAGAADWSVRLEAQASDADGSIAKVEFRSATSLIGSRTAAPWTFDWPRPPAGSHTLTAVATDNKGAKTTSSAVRVRINADPAVAIDAPASLSTLYGPLSIAVVASATDSDGTVSRVEFFGDGRLFASLTSAPYAATWSNVGIGDHAITVVASDDDAGSTSASIAVTVAQARPPLVVLTGPYPCNVTEAPGTLTLYADAESETGSIDRVEFYAGTTLLGSARTAPYSYTWAGVPAGTYSLTARAVDDGGRVANSKPIAISVVPPNVAPHVAISVPAAGASVAVGQATVVEASASDSDGRVTEVVFSVDGGYLSRVVAPPYRATWVPGGARLYTLSALAYDDRGGFAESSPVTVKAIANAAPQVSLTAPQDGAVFVVPASVAVSATAGDADGSIQRVEFLLDGVVAATSTAPPYTGVVTVATTGTHVLSARAIDDLGATASSPPATVTVNSNVPPLVSLVLPANGSRAPAPANLTLTASASDADGSVVRVDFHANSALVGTLTRAPYTLGWSKVAAGDYLLTATATDDKGATSTSATVAVTVTAPVLSITSPADGAALDTGRVTVSGTISAPSNSGVTVNGVAAAIDENNRFFATVRLAPGANTLTATLSTPDGQVASQAIAVASSGPGAIDLEIDRTEGVAPMTVTVDVSVEEGVEIQGIEVDVDGDGTIDHRSSGSLGNPLAVTYPLPGAYPITLAVHDVQGNVYTRSLVVVAQSAERIDGVLRAVWSELNDALVAGDKAAALLQLNPQARARYGPVFDALVPYLPDIIASYSPLQRVGVTSDIGEYAINRTIDGVDRIFFIHFLRDSDGVWRLDDM